MGPVGTTVLGERIEKVAKGKTNAEAYLLAGSTLLQLNEFARARDDVEIALRLNPKLPGIYSLAGTARDNTGDLKGAEAAFRRALEIDHDDFTANLYLGAMLYKRRDLFRSGAHSSVSRRFIVWAHSNLLPDLHIHLVSDQYRGRSDLPTSH